MSDTTPPITGGKEIMLRPMFKKELAAICDCTVKEIRKRIKLFAEKNGEWDQWKGRKKLEKEQVRKFLKHNDILPEKVNLND